jgi:hypothetical protein
MYLEADARMDTFQGQDGSNQTRLNLVQRKTSLTSSHSRHSTNRTPRQLRGS